MTYPVSAKHLKKQLEVERGILALTRRNLTAEREAMERRILNIRHLIYFVENGQEWPVRD